MKIVLLPLDERPCNTILVEKTAKLQTDIEFVMPNLEILGNKKIPANRNLVEKFLIDETLDADILIVSIDMLLYGGLLPSRLHNFTIEDLKNKLDILNIIKKNNPMLKIYAFACIMRTPKYNSSDEEPDYYEEFGYEIYKTKYLEDKKQLVGLSKEEEIELNSFTCPQIYIDDYTNRRTINKQLNIDVIEYLENDVLDYLIIPQDDSAIYGYTRIDQAEVLMETEKLDQEKFSIHPGADEVAMTLLARAYQDKTEKKKIYIYNTSNIVDEIVPNYEDRVASKSLLKHTNAANVVVVNNVDEADIVLVYHLPSSNYMDESWDQVINYNKNYDSIDYNTIIKDIKHFNKDIAIADCAYSNGGDLKLLSQLKVNNIELVAYQGWNTNCNSLGSAIANAIFAIDGNKEAIRKLVFEHIVEDGIYQAYVRKYITDNILENLDLNYFDLKTKQAEIVKLEIDKLEEEIHKYSSDAYKFTIYHPWNRMFEIGVDVDA